MLPREADVAHAGVPQVVGRVQCRRPDATGRLADLLGEFWVAVIGSGLLPAETTLRIGKV
ncbi:hypothetical protein [Streptomyces sp. NPDC060187]|uniref:hypothetical protein n=1 Tax=Streptomyces sp. NPDC060187 TaxID=3347067 RepID=UPI003667D644